MLCVFTNRNLAKVAGDNTLQRLITKRDKVRLIIPIPFFLHLSLKAQDETVRPQLWNNIYLSWNDSDHFLFRNAIAYNMLLSTEYPWNEYSYAGTKAFSIKPWLEGSGRIYLASTRQSEKLRSREIRPYLGLRLSTKAEKRWWITNTSRVEWRNIFYSKGSSNSSLRFRNRTYGVMSLNQQKLGADKTLSLFGYFEAFHNFDNDVVERFFTQYKYKMGVRYRIDYSWRFDFSLIYQDGKK